MRACGAGGGWSVRREEKCERIVGGCLPRAAALGLSCFGLRGFLVRYRTLPKTDEECSTHRGYTPAVTLKSAHPPEDVLEV